MFFLLLSAGANIAAGAVIQNGVTLLNNAIYSPGTGASDVGSFTQNVTHFQLAMFNGCCASRGLDFTKEVYAGIPGKPETFDLDGFVKYCGHLKQDNLDAMSNTNIRSCFKDQESYRIFNHTVGLNLERLCTTFQEAEVNIAGKKVPGQNIDVTGLTGGDETIPIVGPYAKPDYGCGTGYAKAFQAAMLIWAQNIIGPVGTAFIACGAVYVVLFLLAFVATYSCGRSDGLNPEERYARYLEEIQNSSQAASKNNMVQDAQVVDSFEHANPSNRSSVNVPLQPVGSNRMSLQNPNRMSVQSYATHGSQGSGYAPQQYPAQDIDFNVDDKI